jgi:predicted metal-dependent HD superfamily phosphohydrolase
MMGEGLSTWIASLPREWMAGVDVPTLERAHSAYQSPGRHYHTWEHVLACVEHLRSTPCENPRVVLLALVFHDAVYVAGASDNEEQSARLAREVLSSCAALHSDELAAIERLILATKHHVAPVGGPTADEGTVIDIDLSILAAPRREYERYARAIHDEWVPVPASEAAFRIGRLEFLRGMLAAPHVYVTSAARQRWDLAARANMAWEISELTGRQGFTERVVCAIRSLIARPGAQD